MRKNTRISCKGYIQRRVPGHPRADSNGYVMEHILVFEEKTGISVPTNCCIHHLNGNKTDNRIENLCLMECGAHTIFHHTGTKLSDETKAAISKKAKERLSDKRNHPSYKIVDVPGMAEMRKSGASVMDICKKYGIGKTTFYRKMEEYYVSK